MITGHDLEIKLNIVQQYRSRTDKQYSNFISPASASPRQYTDADVLVYEIVFSAKAQKLNRPDILNKLGQMVKSGLIPFYPDARIKSVEDLFVSKSVSEIPTTSPEGEAVNKVPVIRHRQPASTEKKVSGYELAEKFGELKAKYEFQEEMISDLAYEVKKLQGQVDRQNAAIVDLSNRLEVVTELSIKPKGFFEKLFDLFK